MTVRVGLVGLGFMGKVHYENYSAIDGAEVVAVCDLHRDLAEEAALLLIAGDLYDGEIAYVDRSLKRLFDAYRHLGLWNQTIESFGNYAPDMDIYAIYTYGNTVVTALFAVLNEEYARVFSGPAAAAHLETAEQLVEDIHLKVHRSGQI